MLGDKTMEIFGARRMKISKSTFDLNAIAWIGHGEGA
jgi:hypothetical protein